MLIVKGTINFWTEDHNVDMLSIPQEVVDHIVDYLPNDVEALKSCSATCLAMMRRSTPYLFSSITVRTAFMTAFADVLKTSRRLPATVETLVLVDDILEEICPSFILDIALRLPRVKSLRFKGTFHIFSSDPAITEQQHELSNLAFENTAMDIIKHVLRIYGVVEQVELRERIVPGNFCYYQLPKASAKAMVACLDPRSFGTFDEMWRILKPIDVTLDLRLNRNVADLRRVGESIETFGQRWESLALVMPRNGSLRMAPSNGMENCSPDYFALSEC